MDKLCGKCNKLKGCNENSCNCGRPPLFTKELGNKICERIALGESTRNILKDEEMPPSSVFYRWLLNEEKKEFREHYEIACNIRAELMFEQLNEIADESSKIIVGDDKSDGARVQANRLRVDTRKWYLSKVLPKKYGDKIDMTTNGKDLPVPLLNGIYNNNSNQENSGDGE